MILVIGPTGSGKTLLLKQLEELSKNSHLSSAKKKDKSQSDLNDAKPSTSNDQDDARENVPATIPTMGTNICAIKFPRKKEINLKEVGGSMAPIWKSSYEDAEKVIYVIDFSNPFQVSSTTIRLLEMLSDEKLKDKNILLLLNKIDNFTTVYPAEMRYMLMLDSIISHAPQTITTIESSAKYGSGLQDVVDWIYEGT
uniref:ADP-ribosylation factor-like protein 16 n=1 Tax=Styela clava TaxID=7725 RepID=UPI0019393B97|nr:ADP-ribosylation factor-like protein 16 [Styela clava]